MAGFKKTPFYKTLASPRLTLVLLMLFGVAIAVATFIESARGTDAAKAAVYNARWFEFVLALFCLNLVFALGRWWPFRPRLMGFVLIHISVIVILAGAGITRFFGYEGTMFIREGARTGTMYARGNRIWIGTGLERDFVQVRLHGDGPKGLNKTLELAGESFQVEVTDFDPAYGANLGLGSGDGVAAVTVKVTDPAGESMTLLSMRNAVNLPSGRLGGRDISVGFGSMPVAVPFSLHLDDFVVISYPGSDNPVSFESHVRLFDDEAGIEGQPHRIMMNSPLTHRGFKVFQSSYDDDRLGTVLTVNFDPGKLPTYVGYGLITLGFILVFAKDLLWRRRDRKEGQA